MLEALPVSGRLVMTGGVVLMALGVLLPVLLVKVWTLLSFLIHGGVLVPAGVSTLALGAVKVHLEVRAAATRRAESDALVARNAETVRGVLGPSAPTQTIEWIAARLALPEPVIVEALLWLRERGEVEEELDTDSGEWFYRPTPRDRMAGFNLDDRAAGLPRGQR